MKRNVGKFDRTLRFLLALFLVWLGLLPLHGIAGDMPGVAVAMFALVPFVTSAVGYCPFYHLFGASTCGFAAPVQRTPAAPAAPEIPAPARSAPPANTPTPPAPQ